MINIDATFQTNRLGLLLSNITSITSAGKTFPVCFSFKRTEAEETFNMEFEFMDRFIFHDVEWPHIVLSDQSQGLLASINGRPWLQVQLCRWRAVSNTVTRLHNKGYGSERVNHCKDSIWTYLTLRRESEEAP